ncbi:YolD-like family protein [Paenibacillus sambharensis]|uniref:YolD-like family protein n=1 Tax=Paenibacillus sambharensis TaxID=1803190 RepID=A0A2W1LDY2_9BACL|nr:YolD-like family protein [Paenibacillus sambharensis]PZD93265.1 YolD-like family protein [Paenibacillus sambharensis]
MKKLTGNGLWESSRMMLFEHRDSLLDREAGKTKKRRPELDEQHLEVIAEQISAAYTGRQTLHATLYEEYGERQLSGSVTGVDPLRQRVRIGDSWIPVADILEVRIEDATGDDAENGV